LLQHTNQIAGGRTGHQIARIRGRIRFLINTIRSQLRWVTPGPTGSLFPPASFTMQPLPPTGPHIGPLQPLPPAGSPPGPLFQPPGNWYGGPGYPPAPLGFQPGMSWLSLVGLRDGIDRAMLPPRLFKEGVGLGFKTSISRWVDVIKCFLSGIWTAVEYE